MAGKVNFILGVHEHLPNGAAEEEFEALYNSRIRPLVSALYQFPRVNVVFHYSGVLFHWIERHHPELFVLLDDLLNRKQAELLGGGFYEPMMPFLPLTDKIGQIEMLTTYLRKQFGKRPQGCWLPALAWEQNLVGPLNACGMAYTFLDERCFAAANASPNAFNCYRPAITEDQGKLITVFPVSSGLAGQRPSALLEKFLINQEAKTSPDSNEAPVIVFPVFAHNPGEKSETAYQKFFEEFSVSDSSIEFTTPGRIYKNYPGPEKHYFTAPVQDQESSAIQPRQFLTEYPEAGLIYAKMIHTRMLINQLRGDKARKHTSLEELWKAQDSALFSSAGLGSAQVRKAAYRALLEAEKICRGKASFTPSLSVFDYDLDGEDEYVFQDEKINCYIKARGGGIFELDYLPKTWNYLDTFVPFGKGRSSRRTFTEYLVPGKTFPQTNWQDPGNSRYCGEENFQTLGLDRVRRQLQFFLPSREGILGTIEIKKTWQLKRNILSLQYELKNSGANAETFFLVPLINLSFSGSGETYIRQAALRLPAKETIGFDQEKIHQDLGGLEFRDIKNEVVLSLEAARHFDARISTLETNKDPGAAQSSPEYQFTSIMPLLPVSLEPGKSWDTGFTLKISS